MLALCLFFDYPIPLCPRTWWSFWLFYLIISFRHFPSNSTSIHWEGCGTFLAGMNQLEYRSLHLKHTYHFAFQWQTASYLSEQWRTVLHFDCVHHKPLGFDSRQLSIWELDLSTFREQFYVCVSDNFPFYSWIVLSGWKKTCKTGPLPSINTLPE